MADYIDQLIARGVISDDAAARAMTHWPQEPNANVDAFKRGVSDFARGGVYGVLKGQGVDTPEWMDRGADVVNGQGANDALSVTGGGPAVGMARQAGRAYGFWREGGEGLRQLRRMNADRRTQKEIADQFGVSVSQISQVMKREGIEPAHEFGPGARPPDEEYAAALRDMQERGLTQTQMAQERGVSGAAISKKFKKMRAAENADSPEGMGTTPDLSEWQVGPDGTLVRTVGGRSAPSQPVKPAVNEDNERALYDLMHRGLSDHEIAAEFGVRPEAVAARRPALQKKYGNERALFDLMSQGMDDDELAAEYGVSRETMRNRRLDLQRKYGK